MTKHPCAAQGIDPTKPVNHVAGRHVPHGPLEPHPFVVQPEGVEFPVGLVSQPATAPNPSVTRIRQYHIRVLIERVDQGLQPTRVPNVVVAGPREELCIRTVLQRQVEGMAPVVDHAKPLGITAVHDPGIACGIRLNDLTSCIGRVVVDTDQAELSLRLRQ